MSLFDTIRHGPCLLCKAEGRLVSGYCRACVDASPPGELGWFRHCPRCADKRKTTCCACGCGVCLECGHRFSCLPPVLSAPVFLPGAPSPVFVQAPEAFSHGGGI